MTYNRTISVAPEDLDFVDDPPQHLQVECPICYQILRKPHILSCCGWHFCGECIQPIIEEGKPCPMCKEDFTTMIDKSIERAINQLMVSCPSNVRDASGENGCIRCPWKGELGRLESHLSVYQRNGECQFIVVGCMYGCGHEDSRKNLIRHETELCCKRPFSCDYCNDYESTCEDVTENHWPVCEQYPIACPNACETRYLAHGLLATHLEKVCELQEVPCSFAWAGCVEERPRQDLQEHVAASVSQHLSLVSVSCEMLVKGVKQLENTVTTLSDHNVRADALVAKLQEHEQKQGQRIESLEKQVSALTEKVTSLQAENGKLQDQFDKFVEKSRVEKEVVAHRFFSLESSVGVPPFSFIMDTFKERLDKKMEYVSPPFYSHIGGYHLCIKVLPYGIVFGEGTHISLSVHIMKGIFDDSLQWPFRGTITVALQNQLSESGKHHNDTISFKSASDRASGRVTTGKMNEVGLVCYDFIDHMYLKKNERNRTQYLKDDYLCFRVECVTLLTP